MDPVQIERTFGASRIAAGDVNFGRAAERAGDNEVIEFGKGTIVAQGDVAWTPEANVTIALVTGLLGANSAVQCTIAGGFTTDLAASLSFAAKDLSEKTALSFYIKSDISVAAGAIRLGISETTAGGGSPVYVDVPALTAGQWRYCSVALAGAGSTRNAILSVLLNVVTDSGAQVVTIENVTAGELFYGLDGIAQNDHAHDDDMVTDGEDVEILSGRLLGQLHTAITCVAGQPLYPLPGGVFGTTYVNYPGRQVYAFADQATAAGAVEVII